jgi:hypothetical protein
MSGIYYTDAISLAAALTRAEKAHAAHEKQTGQKDPNWPEWYAKFMYEEKVPAAKLVEDKWDM